MEKDSANVTLIHLESCLGCVADSKTIILREVVKEHCYEFTVQQSQRIVLFRTSVSQMSLALSCPGNKHVTKIILCCGVFFFLLYLFGKYGKEPLFMLLFLLKGTQKCPLTPRMKLLDRRNICKLLNVAEVLVF